jgi:hypothetical protein
MTHRRRQLVSGGAGTSFSPETLATSWLRFGDPASVVTGLGFSSVADVLGGSPAIQTVDAQRPPSATNAGRTIAACVNDVLIWPLANARNNQSDKWWLSIWLRPTTVSGTKSVFIVNTSGGGASATRISCSIANTQVLMNIQENATDARRGISPTLVLAAGVASHLFFQFVGSGATEADRNRIFVNASPISLTFAANPTSITTPATLIQPTGNAWLFGANAAAGSPFIGDVGSSIITGTGEPTLADITNLMNFEPLVG